MNKATENKGDVILHSSIRHPRCHGLLESAPLGTEQHGRPERKCCILERVVRKGLSVEVVDRGALMVRSIMAEAQRGRLNITWWLASRRGSEE